MIASTTMTVLMISSGSVVNSIFEIDKHTQTHYFGTKNENSAEKSEGSALSGS